MGIGASASKGTTDITLTFGSDPLYVYVYNGLAFTLDAAEGASAVFTNEGANTVTASCDAGAETYSLPSGVATTIANPKSAAWTPACTVATTDAEDKTSITGTAPNSLSTHLAVGTAPVFMDVVNGSKLKIVASKGGAAVVENKGTDDVTLNCTL